MGMMEQMETLIESGHRLAAFESPHPDRVVDLFRLIGRHTGKAIYHWQPYRGAYRLGSEHILVPDTTPPHGVLRFIDSTQHFAVFLLQDFTPALEDRRTLGYIHKLVNAEEVNTHRLIILLGRELHVPKKLRSLAVRVRHATEDDDGSTGAAADGTRAG